MRKKISFAKIQTLEIQTRGLTASEITRQREKFGSNDIVEVSGNFFKEIFLETIKDPMIWFLILVGIIFFAVGENVDAIVLLVSILPLILMDGFLHWRTQASTAALKGNLASKTSVIRDGKECEINSRDLVPGDLVVLKNNEFLPADGIFLNTQGLQVDESALTGEAFPISKLNYTGDCRQNSNQEGASVDEHVIGLAGTRLLTGTGHLLILETGKETEYAQIVQSVTNVAHVKTPLQMAITKLVGVMLAFAGLLCLVLAIIRFYQGKGLLDAFLSAATLAVAAMPEEFPVVFTFFLGVGVFRLAKKHALVRIAVAVENIGRINRICTDKTGTITIGQLSLTHVIPYDKETELSVLKCALAVSNSQDYDPIDQAVTLLARSKNIVAGHKIAIFPFTEERKRESAIVKEDGQTICFTKGAPESILALVPFPSEVLLQWQERVSQYASEGHKVLACARKNLIDVYDNDEPASDFEFMGLLAFEDPPRPEVKEALQYCHQHGIKVTMITGDHPETARAIAHDVGLTSGEIHVVSAEDESYKFEEAWLINNLAYLKTIDVVARCKPLQKLRVVEALKKSGELVAVTGDGVNDVPALKMADVSIAMGARGTRSAKEVSYMILMDDNFSTIVNAIAEGRQLFQNLKRSFEYLILFHIPVVITAAFIPLLGYPILYLPIQIVWLELIIHPSAMFAFQADVSKSTDHRPADQFFNRREVLTLLFFGMVITLLIIFNYIWALKEINDLGHARARIMGMLCLWSAFLVMVLADLRSNGAKAVIVYTLSLTLLLIQIPFFANLMHVSPIHLHDWLMLILSVALVVGLYKRSNS